MTRRFFLILFTMLPTFVSCQPEKKAMTKLDKEPAVVTIPEGAEVATLGAGCFWCIEAAYNRIDGVISATSGYSGGHVKNPTYEQVCDKTTGHAEVVQVVFDPKKISYERILAWYWDLHDPTTLNRQGNDVGPQYRSVIFYHSPEQKKIAEASKAAAQKNFKDPIVTQIQEATDFYPAENYHQNYYAENKSKNPYCKYVIQPKLQKLHLDD
nr:peptide-methionine (S)-S-oxide reductase MsrA [Luteolibacter pohnpeiensis]